MLTTLKNIQIFLAFITLVLFAGCHKYDDYQYETRGMQILNVDNSEETPFETLDPVSKKAFGIKMEFNMAITKKTSNTDSYESSYVNEDLVESFKISSPDTMNAYLPLSSLNDLFYFSSNTSSGGPITSNSMRYIASGGPSNRHDEGLQEEWTRDQYLFLMYPPNEGGDYTFIVDLYFSDGRLLSDTINVNLF